MKISSGCIQIAGLRDLAEAQMVRNCGAHLLGFPLRLPVHTPDLSEDQAQTIIHAVGPPCCVLITYEDDPRRIADLCRFLDVSTVQIHADVPPATLAALPDHHRTLTIIKSYVIGRDNPDSGAFVAAYAPVCDAFITDTFDPRTGASGATGLVHDWNVSAELVRQSPCPVILAGGLKAENVREAILRVRPAGVDVHTGVENADGSKNESRTKAFVRAATTAFTELPVI